MSAEPEDVAQVETKTSPPSLREILVEIQRDAENLLTYVTCERCQHSTPTDPEYIARLRRDVAAALAVSAKSTAGHPDPYTLPAQRSYSKEDGWHWLLANEEGEVVGLLIEKSPATGRPAWGVPDSEERA